MLQSVIEKKGLSLNHSSFHQLLSPVYPISHCLPFLKFKISIGLGSNLSSNFTCCLYPITY